MFEMMDACRDYLLLKYEDMIENFDGFFSDLNHFIPLQPHVKDDMFKRSRPEKTEDITKHKRSGKVGGYREKLQPETITELNDQLSDILRRLDYPLEEE